MSERKMKVKLSTEIPPLQEVWECPRCGVQFGLGTGATGQFTAAPKCSSYMHVGEQVECEQRFVEAFGK